jgi:predicted GNAT family N-acyltransferase
MPKKSLEKATLGQHEDWYGNNAAVCCPVCCKVFIVSGFLNKGQRQCPRCHESTANITAEELTIEWHDSQEPTVVARSELENKHRLEEFVELVKDGGAVDPESVKKKLPKVVTVAFIEHNGKMIAVAAKKKPNQNNAARISKSSGYQLSQDIPELGYVAVAHDYQGHHLSTKVMRRILVEFGDATVFATTSDSKMKGLLAKNGFRWVGHEWESKRPQMLSLWIKEGGE